MRNQLIINLILISMLVACSGEPVRVYDIAKEEVTENPFSAPPQTASAPAAGGGDLQWDVPDTWEGAGEKPMRLASYQAAEGAIDISVVRLGGDAGGLAANVNRWRGQVNLKPESEQEIARQARTFPLKGIEVTMVELIGPESSTLAGIVPYQGQSWFFKLTGPSERVTAEKAPFENWLKSIRIPGPTAEEQPSP